MNIGGDYEIGRSVRVSVCVSVYTMTGQELWFHPVKTSTLAEIMHSYERFLVIIM